MNLADAPVVGEQVATAPVVDARLPQWAMGMSWKNAAVQVCAWSLLLALSFGPASLRESLFDPRSQRLIVGMGIAGASGMLAAVTVLAVWWQFRRRRLVPDTPTPIEEAIAEQVAATPFLGGSVARRWSWGALSARLDARGVHPPATVISTVLSSRLRRIELTAHMLEPEAILPSGQGNAMGALMSTGFLFFVLLQLMTGNWIFAAFFLVLLGFTLVTTPAVRDLIRTALPWDGRMLAGQGWVRDGRRRVWTRSDSMLIVSDALGTRFVMYFTGPAGVLALSFASERDPDFLRLWRAWNHPDPRPALSDV